MSECDESDSYTFLPVMKQEKVRLLELGASWKAAMFSTLTCKVPAVQRGTNNVMAALIRAP